MPETLKCWKCGRELHTGEEVNQEEWRTLVMDDEKREAAFRFETRFSCSPECP